VFERNVYVICQFSCVEVCPERAPATVLEELDDGMGPVQICGTWAMYNAQKGRLR